MKIVNEQSGKLEVALIGPMPPVRSGVAQYTEQLGKALGDYCQLRIISFKRLYPNWLYPGQDYQDESVSKRANAEYLIDVYNPFSLQKTAKFIADSECDVAIISWWTLFWQPGLAFVARSLRKRGVKVIFLCHNLVDHEANSFIYRLSKVMFKQADGYIVHADEQAKMLQSISPQVKILNRRHPIYTQYLKNTGKVSQRGRLELLFFGVIRSYKGLDVLVEALAELGDKEVHLTVAGEPWGNTEELKKKLLAIGAPNLDLHLEYVNDKDVAKFFTRADVVVLPYKSATGSGVAALAYNYQKPILATKVGGLQDVVVQNKTGWLVDPNSWKALSEAISKIDRAKLKPMKAHIDKFCKDNNWDGMAKAICEFAGELTKPKEVEED